MRQYIKQIYREIEVCPDCNIPMSKKTDFVLTTYPPQYLWVCPQCGKTINSFLSGQPEFIFRDDCSNEY